VNWSHTAHNATVDLTNVVAAGDSVWIRNVQQLGTIVYQGVYQGGNVSLPVGQVTPPIPVGSNFTTPPTTHEGSVVWFDAFVVDSRTPAGLQPPPGTVTFNGINTFSGFQTTVVPATYPLIPKRRCEFFYTVSNDVPSGWTATVLVNGVPVSPPMDGGNNAAVHTDGSTLEYKIQLSWPSQYSPKESQGLMITGLNSGSHDITCIL